MPAGHANPAPRFCDQDLLCRLRAKARKADQKVIVNCQGAAIQLALAMLLILTVVLARPGTATSAAVPEICSEWVEREVKAPAIKNWEEVKIRCNLSLRSTDRISKRLVFDGSAPTGVTVDCNGATLDPRGTVNEDKTMIEVRADYLGQWQWDTPENISITDCTIFGSVEIYSGGACPLVA